MDSIRGSICWEDYGIISKTWSCQIKGFAIFSQSCLYILGSLFWGILDIKMFEKPCRNNPKHVQTRAGHQKLREPSVKYTSYMSFCFSFHAVCLLQNLLLSSLTSTRRISFNPSISHSAETHTHTHCPTLGDAHSGCVHACGRLHTGYLSAESKQTDGEHKWKWHKY